MYRVDIKSTNSYCTGYEDGYVIYYKKRSFGYPVEFDHRMYKWLNDNNIDRESWRLYNRYVKIDFPMVEAFNRTEEFFGIGFVNEEDAVAFKLRWL